MSDLHTDPRSSGIETSEGAQEMVSRGSEAPEELCAVLMEVAPKAGDAARAELYRTLARLQVDLGEPAEALASWKRVLELKPTDHEALDGTARLVASQHDDTLIAEGQPL